jgi:hypothetical protein
VRGDFAALQANWRRTESTLGFGLDKINGLNAEDDSYYLIAADDFALGLRL